MSIKCDPLSCPPPRAHFDTTLELGPIPNSTHSAYSPIAVALLVTVATAGVTFVLTESNDFQNQLSSAASTRIPVERPYATPVARAHAQDTARMPQATTNAPFVPLSTTTAAEHILGYDASLPSAASPLVRPLHMVGSLLVAAGGMLAIVAAMLRRRKSAEQQPLMAMATTSGAKEVEQMEAVEEVDAVQAEKDEIGKMLSVPYKWGFTSEVESEKIAKGLTEDTVRLISAKKEEPDWMLEFRLKAFRRWQQMEEPKWSDNHYPTFDYQSLSYYSEPKVKEKLESLDEVDPEILATFDKLGIPLSEQKRLSNVAVDAVFDSVSIATTFREELLEHGVIFCSISEAIKQYPDLVKKYMGSVVPVSDNYFTALNSAVFSDGSFVYIPKGVRCPMELSTYFRINERETGQFERTLIIAEDESYVSYLEGCTAPSYDENQLHAAVVELWAGEDAEIKYSTVQNWYAGNEQGEGGIYNFVTKRGLCNGNRSKISWTQVETGSAITWKYPSCVLKGDGSKGEFYSVALTNNMQQADTGTKMVHIGKDTRSRIISKGISAGQSCNVYRGLVKVGPNAESARNYSQCDSMLIGTTAQANTYPYIEVRQDQAQVEHEASTSRISEEQLFYMQQRGIAPESAVGVIVSGFCSEVFNELPLEFAQEVNQLMNLKLEGSVG